MITRDSCEGRDSEAAVVRKDASHSAHGKHKATGVMLVVQKSSCALCLALNSVETAETAQRWSTSARLYAANAVAHYGLKVGRQGARARHKPKQQQQQKKTSASAGHRSFNHNMSKPPLKEWPLLAKLCKIQAGKVIGGDIERKLRGVTDLADDLERQAVQSAHIKRGCNQGMQGAQLRGEASQARVV